LICVWNLDCLTEEETQAESVIEQGAEEDIWALGDDVTGEWRRLHNEELHDLQFSPDTIRLIKPRRMRWAGHVEYIG
jgi:hypothetical protein